MALSTSQMQTLLTWTNARAIYQIYSVSPGYFNKSSWKSAIAGRNNLVFVGKTYTGAVVGGFIGNARIPTYETGQWLSSPNSFVFNLKTNKKWYHSYSSLNIWINTYSWCTDDCDSCADYCDLVDFGRHKALQFEAPNGFPTVSYAKSNDFKRDPTNTQMGVLTSDMQLSSFEVYEIYY